MDTLLFQDFAQDEADSEQLDDTLLQNANAILVDFFGPDGFSSSMRWAADPVEDKPAETADIIDKRLETEDDDIEFPDEK